MSTPFFDTCQGKVIFEEKVIDLEETKRCTRLESADGSPSDGLEEYVVKMLICPFWCSADG